MACSNNKPFDVQGHRGCRGLYPENSLNAMKHALDLGVSTLELDVVITKDQQVVVSHEPFLSHEICRHPDGRAVTKNEERQLNIYSMSFDSLSTYDCGLKKHPRFPNQKKEATSKPLLKELIEASEKHAIEQKRSLPLYNIETKSTVEGDQIYHPTPEPFVDLLMEVIDETGIRDRTVIQSFDVRTLQVAKKKYPDVRLALLVENQDGIEANLEMLGFLPEIYSCDFQLIDRELLDHCKKKNIELIPWTVNDVTDMNRLIDLEVDGIITDYPDLLMEVIEERKMSVK
jgi:glycerophosphoryl diester phosphodiesterase